MQIHHLNSHAFRKVDLMVAAKRRGDSQVASGTRRGRLLLVDDDQDIVRGTKLRLMAVGYEVIEACDGRRCLDLAESQQPDAILLDVRMPGQDGLATLATLRSNEATSHIPVVMLSGSIADEEPALEQGARFFLRKPCRSESLLAAVEFVIRERTAADSE